MRPELIVEVRNLRALRRSGKNERAGQTRVGTCAYRNHMQVHVSDRLHTHPDQVDPAEFFARFLDWTRRWAPLRKPGTTQTDERGPAGRPHA